MQKPIFVEVKKTELELAITSLAWSQNGQWLAYVATYSDCSVCHIIDVRTKERTVLRTAVPITALAWGPESIILLGLENGMIEIWDISRKEKIYEFQAGNEPVKHLSLSRDGNYMTSSVNNHIVDVWSTTGTSIKKITSLSFDKTITALQWSPYNYDIALALHDIHNQEPDSIEIFRAQQIPGDSISFFPIATYEQEARSEISSIVWSPSSRYLAVALETGRIAIYDNFLKERITSWMSQDFGCIVSEIAWSADEKYVISGGIDTINVWDPLKGQLIATELVQDQREDIFSDLTSVMTQYTDGTLREHLFETSEGPFVARRLAWSPHGLYIAAALRRQTEGVFPHILVIFEPLLLYKDKIKIQKLWLRELLGKRDDTSRYYFRIKK